MKPESTPERSTDEKHEIDDCPVEPLHDVRSVGWSVVLSGVDSTDLPQPDGREPRLDPQALAKLAELDPTGGTRLVERVLRAFLGSIANLRPQFERGWAEQDMAAVRLVVHTLKSSSASIGAVRLAEVCSAIENAIRLGHQAQLAPLVATAGGAFDDAVRAIEAVLKVPSS